MLLNFSVRMGTGVSDMATPLLYFIDMEANFSTAVSYTCNNVYKIYSWLMVDPLEVTRNKQQTPNLFKMGRLFKVVLS